MKLFYIFTIGAFSQLEKFLDEFSERGIRSCQGIKVQNDNGIEWFCGTRGPEFKPKKKCRGIYPC